MSARHGHPDDTRIRSESDDAVTMIPQPTPLNVLVASDDETAEPVWMLVIGWADGPDADHPVLPVAVSSEGSAAPRVVYDPQGFRRSE